MRKMSQYVTSSTKPSHPFMGRCSEYQQKFCHNRTPRDALTLYPWSVTVSWCLAGEMEINAAFRALQLGNGFAAFTILTLNVRIVT